MKFEIYHVHTSKEEGMEDQYTIFYQDINNKVVIYYAAIP